VARDVATEARTECALGQKILWDRLSSLSAARQRRLSAAGQVENLSYNVTQGITRRARVADHIE